MTGCGMMVGSGMSGAGMYGMSLYGLVYLALATFIVSAIFWATYKWIIKGKKLI